MYRMNSIMEDLHETPELKRRVILKVMEELLDGEALLGADPTLYDPSLATIDPEYREKACDEMAQTILRLFHKNKVHPEDAESVLDRVKERYERQYNRPARSEPYEVYPKLDHNPNFKWKDSAIATAEHFGCPKEDILSEKIGYTVCHRSEVFARAKRIMDVEEKLKPSVRIKIEVNYDPSFETALLTCRIVNENKKGSEKNE